MLHTPASFVPLHSADSYDPHAAYSFVFRGDELLVHAGRLTLPDDATFRALDAGHDGIHAVGLWHQRFCRAAALPPHAAPPAGHVFMKLRALFGAVDEQLLSIAGRAYQIVEWARTHRYCGVCATPMQAVAGERCRACPACGMTAYPRISPVMMVLVRKGDAILLARHTASPTGRFSALAGFLEAGESVEDAVHREVHEEVGLRVDRLRYFGSQSWPFPHSLMIAFTAEYVSGEIRIDEREIAEARWFAPGDTLPEIAPDVSIAGALISAHLASAP